MTSMTPEIGGRLLVSGVAIAVLASRELGGVLGSEHHGDRDVDAVTQDHEVNLGTGGHEDDREDVAPDRQPAGRGKQDRSTGHHDGVGQRRREAGDHSDHLLRDARAPAAGLEEPTALSH
jgi:hypothetical protein